ncbi:MAG: hypothetical protein U0768_06770 [Anaerolineae bacterium]
MATENEDQGVRIKVVLPMNGPEYTVEIPSTVAVGQLLPDLIDVLGFSHERAGRSLHWKLEAVKGNKSYILSDSDIPGRLISNEEADFFRLLVEFTAG